MTPSDLGKIGGFISGIAAAFNVVVVLAVAAMAFTRFKRYEERQLKTQLRTSLHPTLAVKVLPSAAGAERILALTVQIQNLGKVVVPLDAHYSWFKIDQLQPKFLYDPADLYRPEGETRTDESGRPLLIANAVLQAQYSTLRAPLGTESPLIEIEPGTTVAYAQCFPAFAAIYRVSVNLMLTLEASIATGLPLEGDSRAAWTVATIVDAREIVSDQTVAAPTQIATCERTPT